MSDDAVAVPSCATCPWMRWEGNTMRCYHEPPVPMYVGAVPSKIQGMPPVLVSVGLSPEVHPDRFCRHHPLLAGGVAPPMGRLPSPMLATHGAGEARN